MQGPYPQDELVKLPERFAEFTTSAIRTFAVCHQELSALRHEFGVVQQHLGAVRHELGALKASVTTLSRSTSPWSPGNGWPRPAARTRAGPGRPTRPSPTPFRTGVGTLVGMAAAHKLGQGFPLGGTSTLVTWRCEQGEPPGRQ